MVPINLRVEFRVGLRYRGFQVGCQNLHVQTGACASFGGMTFEWKITCMGWFELALMSIEDNADKMCTEVVYAIGCQMPITLPGTLSDRCLQVID